MVGSVTRWSEQGGARGDDYDARWRRLQAAGESIHGEADLIEWFGPSCVLDAGCGTGRVAVELARRGVEAVGVDLDPAMLASARRKGPGIEWIEGNLADVTVADSEGRPRAFDAVAMAGNVMIFLDPGTEAAVLANMARHLRPGGRIVAGFQLDRPRWSGLGRLRPDGGRGRADPRTPVVHLGPPPLHRWRLRCFGMGPMKVDPGSSSLPSRKRLTGPSAETITAKNS